MDILDRIRAQDEESLPLIDKSIARYRELKQFLDGRIDALLLLKKSFGATTASPTASGKESLPRGTLTTHITDFAREVHPGTVTMAKVMKWFLDQDFEAEYGRMPSRASVRASLNYLWKDKGVLKRIDVGEFILVTEEASGDDRET